MVLFEMTSLFVSCRSIFTLRMGNWEGNEEWGMENGEWGIFKSGNL